MTFKHLVITLLALLTLLPLVSCGAEVADSIPVVAQAQMRAPERATANTAVPPTAPPPTEIAPDTPVPAPTPTLPLAYTIEIPFSPKPAPTSAASYPEPALGPDELPTSTYRILNAYPHDRSAYTQGLVVEDSAGILLEGTGLRGHSRLRRVALEDGSVLLERPLEDRYFGEGIAIVGDRIIQLTWKAGIGFVYDRQTFELLQQFSYPHEGWGITYDGERLIVSDGTSRLRFWDPDTLEETGFIEAQDGTGSIYPLNELEMVNGEVWANVYYTDLVARIDPRSGQVLGWVDFTGLLALEYRDGTENVLNGIAYDAQTGRLFVTGKRWPLLFEIEVVDTP